MCNKNVIKVTSATNSGGTLVLNSNSPLTTLCNRKEYMLLICTSIPASTTLGQATLIIGDSKYPLQDCVGNNLMSDQIKCRRCYPMVFSTNPAHFKLCTCTGRSGAEPCSVAVSAAASPKTAASAKEVSK